MKKLSFLVNTFFALHLPSFLPKNGALGYVKLLIYAACQQRAVSVCMFCGKINL